MGYYSLRREPETLVAFGDGGLFGLVHDDHLISKSTSSELSVTGIVKVGVLSAFEHSRNTTILCSRLTTCLHHLHGIDSMVGRYALADGVTGK